ncbi:MAG: RsmD family RNA methyltransferase [Thermoguttaceae bacterium]
MRVIGGRLRGRKLSYGGDLRVRPMKDRTREAVFNLLGPAIRGMRVADLFAGTGAMAIEAVSRGAVEAVLVERHLPTARIIQQNIDSVGIRDQCTVVSADAFRWSAENPDFGGGPWVVFCCPPYDFFVDRQEDLLNLIGTLCRLAVPGSAIVVESDERFDHALLPEPDQWDSRHYQPAIVGIRWKK